MGKIQIEKQETGFAQIANDLLNDKRLSWKAKGIYAYIYSKPDDWDFSAKRMADDVIDGRDGTLSGIKELEDAGYITRKKLPNGRILYYVRIEPEQAEADLGTPKPEPPQPTMASTHCGESRPISNKEEKVIKSKSNKEYIIRFENFWKAYPKKVSKKKALEKWLKLKPDQHLFETIMKGVEDYKKTEQWKKDNGTFVPMPVTFLNQERYHDEIVPNKEIQQRPVRTVLPERQMTERQREKNSDLRFDINSLTKTMKLNP